MNLDMLQTELERAEDAEILSDDQLRRLTDLIDKTFGPNPKINAGDCAKIVSAALALNDRLRARTEKIKADIRCALIKAETAADKAKRDAKRQALTR